VILMIIFVLELDLYKQYGLFNCEIKMINQLKKMIEHYKYNTGKNPDFINITPAQLAELKSENRYISYL